jgi:hypothetical protein
MRTFLKAAAGAAVLSAFIVAAAGCSNGTTGAYLPQAAVYAGESGGKTYTLIVSDGGGYTLFIEAGGTVTVSTGAVDTDGTYKPDDSFGSTPPSFSITTAGRGITDITGTITLNTGGTVTGPGTVSPSTPEPGGSIVGTWEGADNVPWTDPTGTYFDGDGISNTNYTYSIKESGNRTWTFDGDYLSGVLAVLESKNMLYRGQIGENDYESQPGTVVTLEKDRESFRLSNPGDLYWSKFGNLTTLVFTADTLSISENPDPDDVFHYSLNGTSITIFDNSGEHGPGTTTAVINGGFLIIGQGSSFGIAGVYKRK